MDDSVRKGLVSKETSMSNITSEASRNAELRNRIRHYHSVSGVKESENQTRCEIVTKGGEDQSSEPKASQNAEFESSGKKESEKKTRGESVTKAGEGQSSESDHADIIEKEPTFQLKLRMTPDFMNLLKANLAQAEEEFENQKLKISSSIAMSLKIGNWEVKNECDRELNVKFFHAAEKLVWEISEKGLKRKMEIQFSDIVGINAHVLENGVGILQIELIRPPAFFQEENPKPRKHPRWTIVSDFTQGQAPIFRRHFATFPVRSLDENYDKLLKFNDLLAKLSKKPLSTFGSPYFHQARAGKIPPKKQFQLRKKHFPSLESPYLHQARDVNLPQENQFQQPIYPISFQNAGQLVRHISKPITSTNTSSFRHAGQSGQHISEPIYSMTASTHPMLDQTEGRSNQYGPCGNNGTNNNNTVNLHRNQIESGPSDQDISELFSMKAPTYRILDQVEERSNQYDSWRNQRRNNNNAMNLQRTQIEPAAPWTSSSRTHPAYIYQNTEHPIDVQNYLISRAHHDWMGEGKILRENPFMSTAHEKGKSFPQKELTQDNLAANDDSGLSNMQYLPSSHTSFQAYDGHRPSSHTFSQIFNEHLPLETPHDDPVQNILEEIIKNIGQKGLEEDGNFGF